MDCQKRIGLEYSQGTVPCPSKSIRVTDNAYIQPLPFPTLQPASRSFLAYLFSSLFIATQTPSPLLALPSNPSSYNSSDLESIFLALAASHPEVARAIGWFFEASKEVKKECAKNEMLQWARETAVEAINAATR